ncbi:MAG: Holliday junction resolvase RuvX [bacterium]|nr:Holliday junction resolvase RuvX [bacterium]
MRIATRGWRVSSRERVLGIDPGKTRVGLAVSDELGMIAQGLETYIRGRGSFLDHIRELVSVYNVVRIVIGYPLNMDSSEGASAESARKLAEKLEEELKLPVKLWDERLTTAEAHKAFPPGSRKDWDMIAAMFILQGWLDSRCDLGLSFSDDDEEYGGAG